MTNPIPQNMYEAEQWAISVGDASTPQARAAATVILNLPTTIIDGTTIQEAMDRRDSQPSGDDYDDQFYEAIHEALKQAQPTAPTLADLTPTQRQTTHLMQAHWHNGPHTHHGIIISTMQEVAHFLRKDDQSLSIVRMDKITPLPHLPRMTFPQGEDEPQDTQPTTQFDPAYIYQDDEGDNWQNINGKWRWWTGTEWSIKKYDTPDPECAPYTRLELASQNTPE